MGLKLYAYMSGVKIGKGKYILCGGVTSKLTKISNEVFLFDA